MVDDAHGEILQAAGFTPIAALNHRIRFAVWWHAVAKIQALILPFGDDVLLRGNKPFVLRSISPVGETWARDLGPLHD